MAEKSSQISDRILEARRLAEEGRIAEALRIVDALAFELPDDADIAYEQASVVSRHVPQALPAANAYAKRFPDDFRGPLLQAYANLGMRRGRVALERLEEAERLGAPEYALNPLRMRALAATGNVVEARRLADWGLDVESLGASFTIDPPTSEYELEERLASLKAAGESAANLANWRSWWLGRQGMWPEAAACVRSALEEEPDSVSLNDRMARIAYQMGDLDLAKLSWTKALAKAPENIQARNGLAWVALRRGQIFLAVREFVGSFRYVANLRRGPSVDRR